MADKKARNPIFTIFMTIFLDLLGVGLIIPILAPLILKNETGLLGAGTTFGYRTLMFSLILAAFAVAQFFSAPVLGSISDRVGRKKVLIYSLIATFSGYLLFILGIHYNSLIFIFLGRVIPGLGSGNITIAYSSIADVSTPENKTKNFGTLGIAFGLGFVIGPFLGGQLSNNHIVPWFTLNTPFIVAAFLSLFNLFLVLRNFNETLIHKRNERIHILMGVMNIAKAFSFPQMRSLYSIVFIYSFGFAFFTQFFMVLLVQKFNYHQEDIGMLYGYLGIWVAISQGLILRPLSKKWPAQKIALVSMPMMVIAMFAMIFPAQSFYLYMIIPFVAFAQSSSNSSLTAVVSNLAGPEIQGEMLGITLSMGAAAQAIPALIGGFLVAGHIMMPVIICSASAFISWIMYIIFYQKKHHEKII